MAGDRGLLIAGMGLPGSGKSSTFKELGALLGARVFLEPEEKDWPSAMQRRDEFGHFTGISWFRAARVPQLIEADTLRGQGAIVLVDSYYDKLLSYYLHTPGMEWVMPPGDPYFRVAEELARLDFEHLPDADILVFIEIDEAAWQSNLTTRGRDADQHRGLQESFQTQEHMRAAAEQYCAARGARLVVFPQRRSSPREAAEALLDALREHGLASGE
jgi:thymidylate kinase